MGEKYFLSVPWTMQQAEKEMNFYSPNGVGTVFHVMRWVCFCKRLFLCVKLLISKTNIGYRQRYGIKSQPPLLSHNIAFC